MSHVRLCWDNTRLNVYIYFLQFLYIGLVLNLNRRTLFTPPVTRSQRPVSMWYGTWKIANRMPFNLIGLSLYTIHILIYIHIYRHNFYTFYTCKDEGVLRYYNIRSRLKDTVLWACSVRWHKSSTLTIHVACPSVLYHFISASFHMHACPRTFSPSLDSELRAELTISSGK